MRRLPTLALASPLLLLGACRSRAVYSISVDTSRMEEVDSATAGGTLDVNTGGSVLSRTIEVSRPRRREVAGLTEVQFDLHNRSSRENRFDYRFEWADASGMRIDTAATHWTPVVLGGQETLPLAATAPQVDAVRCTLKVRFSR